MNTIRPGTARRLGLRLPVRPDPSIIVLRGFDGAADWNRPTHIGPGVAFVNGLKFDLVQADIPLLRSTFITRHFPDLYQGNMIGGV